MILLFLLLMLFYLIYIEKLLFSIPWNFFINNSMELKKIIIIKIHEYLKYKLLKDIKILRYQLFYILLS